MSSRKVIAIMCFILFVSVFYAPNLITPVESNPLSMFFNSSGGILPDNGTNLQMLEANVVMEIDETYGRQGDFEIIFDGNYTIYNPDNTTEVLLGAPFQSAYAQIGSTLKIEIDGMEVNHTIVYFSSVNETSNPWDVYFQDDDWNRRYFALCNVTFEGQSNTTVRYSFYSIYNHGKLDSIFIMYDVGTARAWNGVPDETVEFRAYGDEKEGYWPKINDTDPIMPIRTELENGWSYKWHLWLESQFEEYPVISLSYSYPWTSKTNIPLFDILITMSILIAIDVLVKKSIRKSKD